MQSIVRPSKWCPFVLTFLLVWCAPGSNSSMASGTKTKPSSYDSPIGKLEFINGFEKGVPTPETTQLLQRNFDLNNASTAYTWGIPIVAFYQIKQNLEKLGADYGDIVSFQGLDQVRPFLTSNNSTPYIFSIFDLGQTGPVTLEIPAGALLGFVNDAWQRPVVDLGVTGKGQGKGETVVLIGPEDDADAFDTEVVQSKTNFVFIVYRVLDPDPTEADRLLKSVKHYPYGSDKQKTAGKVIVVDEAQTWRQSQPRGMEYWRVLNDAIQNEPVEERDRFIHGMLGPLGIAKGNDFNPTTEQKEILKQGVFMGEATVKALTFEKRFATRVWREGSQWEHLLNVTPYQRTEYTDQFEERAVWFYEATTMSESYYDETVGVGTRYLAAYKSKDNQFLDGAKKYMLRVPADVPAKLFWDVSVYENDGRIYIKNETDVVNLGSRDKGLKVNEDGTTDIYFGPTPPSGELVSNWIQTNPGANWFSLFRFYGPLKPFYDGTFTLVDIEQH
jgi:hypothetical protein